MIQSPFTETRPVLRADGSHFSGKDAGTSSRPEVELADIFRQHGSEYRKNHKLTKEQHTAVYAISNCRTAAYGFHADACGECGHTQTEYNSCRNRNCPKCQGISKRKWVASRLDELLPVCYHHAVFTLPAALSQLSTYNRVFIYDLLFEAASKTLLCFGNDPKWLGARIGFYGILHTWSQTLWTHVHLHFIVTAGGLTPEGEWKEPGHKGKFLFPVRALSAVFRGKFVEGLKKAYYAGELVFPDDKKYLENPSDFEQWVDRLVSKKWVVNSKPPFSGPEEVVRYIGRYTHRTAISNFRILSFEEGFVTFSYKDNKERDKSKKWKEMILSAEEFMMRFLSHVLPSGYHRIRHYGFLANGRKNESLEKIRENLHIVETGEAHGEDGFRAVCPKCGVGIMRTFIVTDHEGRIIKFDFSEISDKLEEIDTS